MIRSLISEEHFLGGEVTDYRLAKELGWNPTRISRYVNGQSVLDDDACQTVAKVLAWPLETVLACIYLERSKRLQNDNVTSAWERICQRVAVGVVPFFCGFFGVIHFFG